MSDGVSGLLALVLMAVPVVLLVLLVANPVWALFLTGVGLVIGGFAALTFLGTMEFVVLLVAGLILLGLGAIARTGIEIAAQMSAGQQGLAKQLADMQAALDRIAAASDAAAAPVRAASLVEGISQALTDDRP